MRKKLVRGETNDRKRFRYALIAALPFCIFLAVCISTFFIQPASAVTWTPYNGHWIDSTTISGTSIEMWNATGLTTWTAPNGVSGVWYLVVAGGGAGGGSPVNQYSGGGGGAGGFLNGTVTLTGGSTYNIAVGAGGTGTSGASGTDGSNSSFANTTPTNGIQAMGGGHGSYIAIGGNGGSGGGGSGKGLAGGTRIIGQGNIGGFSSQSTHGGGGGGGGTGLGSDGGGGSGGSGGAGNTSAITGTSTIYAGGGGGGGTTLGPGGTGGGGDGGSSSNGASGTVNTGGGGGGGDSTKTTAYAAGNGGSGIVIIRYSLGPTTSGFTGSPTAGVFPLTVQFNLTSMNNNATWVNWTWGDGTVSNTSTLLTFNASHTYSSGGTYTVSESAANPQYTNITTLSNYITVNNKTVSKFTSNVTSGVFPFTVQFNLTSMNNNATWVNWTWGDGTVSNTSTLQTFNASHIYSSIGTFTVSESASNPYYTNTTTHLNYIISSPIVAISLNATTIPLTLEPGNTATDSSLGIIVSANTNFSVTVADSSGRGSNLGYMGNYTSGAYVTSPLNTYLASPLSLAGTTNTTVPSISAYSITLPGGSQLYSGSAAVTNQPLANTFTQPVSKTDPVLPSGSTYRIDLTYTITAL